MPRVVIMIDNNIEYIKVWCEYINAANLFLWPNELEINELQPATIPIPAEMIIKYNGKDFAKAAKASEDIFPAKNVSTILNSVWNILPVLAGIAIFFNNWIIGFEVMVELFSN